LGSTDRGSSARKERREGVRNTQGKTYVHATKRKSRQSTRGDGNSKILVKKGHLDEDRRAPEGGEITGRAKKGVGIVSAAAGKGRRKKATKMQTCLT